MGLSIDGLAKTLPLPLPAPAAIVRADTDAEAFGKTLDAAAARVDAKPSDEPKAVAKRLPDENTPIRNDPGREQVNAGRQAIAGDGKDAPTADQDDDEARDRPSDTDHRKTILAVPPWAVIAPPPPPTASPVVAKATTRPGTAGTIAASPGDDGDHAPASSGGAAASGGATAVAAAGSAASAADETFARITAAPDLVVPIARLPVPQPAAAKSPVTAAAADGAIVTPTTGGALAAAAVHTADANSGGQAGGGDARRAPGHAAIAVDTADLTTALPPLTAPIASTIPAATAAPTADAVLDTRDPAWMATLVDKMAEARDANGSRSITMTLRPDALGAVEVSLRQSSGQLHVVFTAADAAARSLLGDARSQLATLAADRGLDLASAVVGGGGSGATDGSAGRQPDHRPAATPFARWGPARIGADETIPESPSSARTIRERTA